jgi:hypothetical protein
MPESPFAPRNGDYAGLVGVGIVTMAIGVMTIVATVSA